MKEIKDIFSKQAAAYAGFRPVYPSALYDLIFQHVKAFNTAWDCGTGNGQAARILAGKFAEVFATDISAKQLEHATQLPNIHYSVQRAEQTDFADHSFDLITIGTALHWFDFDRFYEEVRRVARPGAVIAAWAYAPFRSTPAIDALIDHFYNSIHDYWDPERRFVEEEYKTIPFPFEEINVPEMFIETEWTNEQFIGYLNSWSAVQHYINKNGTNPVDEVEGDIRKVWKDGERINIRIPLFIRIGRIN